MAVGNELRAITEQASYLFECLRSFFCTLKRDDPNFDELQLIIDEALQEPLEETEPFFQLCHELLEIVS
jgi:hypothetical protein